MAEWPIYTVHQLVELGVIERPMDGNHGSIHPKATDFVESGIPFIMASDLKGGRVDLVNCSFISEERASQLSKGFSKPGDVLLSHKATLGRTAIVQANDFPFIMLTPQVTYYRIKDRKKLNNRFLKYYFNSRQFLDIFEAWAGGGSTRAYLGITAQRGLPIPMPPIEVQISIAELIGPLDDKIELNRRMNETLEATARAIFKDWFVDFGPTRAKMDARAPYLAADVWSLFPNRLDEDGKPEGWTTSTIGEEVDVVGGSTPSTKEAAFWGGDISWATPKDLSSLSTPVLLSTERQITNAGLSQISSGLLPVGTVLLSSRAPIGYMAIAQTPVAVNQGFIAMICKKRLSNVFVWLWTQANMETVHQNANGSTFQEISKANFRPIEVTVATSDLLRTFDESMRPLFNRIVSNERESRILATTRDLLLPKLMSGEVRVSNADRIAGDTT
ncbi:restriction endonuclease subunit S [Bradyrhizobium sp. WBOS7]|uniref:Restriction endonuclease subunit S n=1 Tax=Bradyrhizobium betae TaxID=244734 RepID=A0AAE9N523_9BRAD|nr:MULTISPECIES: restriction endonuclease subunit S [Bradyrhizobium]MDD1574353.1 restriction endonuclease subunit S [Bradyrhizobium sp. WBOS1]UUO33790.1 restriction endonuclease subunit S [Bradyrhizobium sp. WBOS01]MDD1530896.1 restriction endonuclease subunit S [Bradyrhizobium sp. WBOS2]MDD1580388.1 restriction endonuclease subunit S [Bradyrhizobium sp. WBOS7]MDD1603690.1 restriction endonuclease subunit S [Bradyrhizobium sp. WBOS16]